MLHTLRDERDGQGWQDFHARYWPVLVGLGVHLGLREADAQDAAQTTLLDFVKELRAGRYERGKGRLRAFILGIARNRIRTLRRESRKAGLRHTLQENDAPIDAHHASDGADEPSDEALQQAWETQRDAAMLGEALQQLRASPKLAPSTLEAFELVTLRGVPVSEAARQTGLSCDEVYLAKHRCAKRLRELIEQVRLAWDSEDNA
jgi:RNA polymerase sigma factor (sigma-70 family)